MSSPRPVLYVFAIFHYCEKARWALDHLGIDYELQFLAPGSHRKLTQELGTSESSLPILKCGDEVIQGSAKILDWAESNRVHETASLRPVGHEVECKEIEQRIDDIVGVHVRRYFYSEALVEHPKMVREIFARDLPLSGKLFLLVAWGKIRQLMIKYMDLGAAQGVESKNTIQGELSWIDELLAGEKEYLLGDRFSRADIAVASLLAPLVMPDTHPTYCSVEHPPRMAMEIPAWEHHLSLRWTRNIYASHRYSPTSKASEANEN